MLPKFSIICPCYNSEKYVEKAIKSVLNQTYKNFELILINDGSTDDTSSIIEKYKLSDNRISIINKTNGGYSTAINASLHSINGDYFLMMGSDDWLDKTILENIANSIKDTLPDIIAFKTVQVDGNGNKVIEFNTDFAQSLVYKCNFKSLYEKHNYESRIFRLRDTSKCFRTSILKETNLMYFGKYGYDADGIFSLLFSHACSSFAIVNSIGYYWLLRSDSVSGRKISYEINVDRLDNCTKFVKYASKLKSNEITDIDLMYAVKGLYIIKQIREIRFSLKDCKLALMYIKSLRKFKQKNKFFVISGKRRQFNLILPIISYVFNLF